MMESWQFAGRDRLSRAELAKQEKQNRTGYTTHPASAHWFVNDVANPYSEDFVVSHLHYVLVAWRRSEGAGVLTAPTVPAA